MKLSILITSACLFLSGIMHAATVNISWDTSLSGGDGQYSFLEHDGMHPSHGSIYIGSSLDLSLSGSEWLYKGNKLNINDYSAIWNDFNSSFSSPATGSNSITWTNGFSMEFSITSTDLSDEIKNSPLFAIIANGNNLPTSTQFSLISFTKENGSLLKWGDLTSSSLHDLNLITQVEGMINAQIVIGNLDPATNQVKFEMTSEAIPEPSTAALSIVSLVGLLARRRRK